MQNQPMAGGGMPAPRRKHRLSFAVKFMRVEVFTVLVGIALLLVAVALYAGIANPTNESKQINKNEYQAVFLTNGQVYFGRVTDLNSKYLILTNIFYIENTNPASSNTNTTPQTTSYTLRKLGTSELHMPEDKMVITTDTVTFWENLKDSSQVVTKIKEYYKNPGGATQTTPSTNSSTGQ